MTGFGGSGDGKPLTLTRLRGTDGYGRRALCDRGTARSRLEDSAPPQRGEGIEKENGRGGLFNWGPGLTATGETSPKATKARATAAYLLGRNSFGKFTAR
jgi:hypothetical protein